MHYMDANKATNIVKSFLSPGRPIVADVLTNSIIFVENSDNARTILGVLKALDINVFRELSMEIVPVQSITPQDAAQGMEALVGKLAVFKESSLKNNLAFIPLPNFGGVLILAQDPEVLRNARSWLTALDTQGKETGEQIYVYFAQNSLAADISNVLTQAYGLSGPSGGGMGQRVVQSTRQGGVGAGGRSGFGSSGFGSSSRSGSSRFGSSSYGSSGLGSSGSGSSGFGSSGLGLFESWIIRYRIFLLWVLRDGSWGLIDGAVLLRFEYNPARRGWNDQPLWRRSGRRHATTRNVPYR